MGNSDHRHLKYLQNICTYLFMNYTKPLTIDKMAVDLHISKRKVQRIIHDHFHTTFKKLLNAIRLYKTIEHYKQNNESILSLALECGFTEERLLKDWWRKCITVPFNKIGKITDPIEANFNEECRYVLEKMLNCIRNDRNIQN